MTIKDKYPIEREGTVSIGEVMEYDKRKILKAMRNILNLEEISSQNELLMKLKERIECPDISQSTISRYLDELKFEKRLVDGKSIYVKSIEKEHNDIKNIIVRLINYANPTYEIIHRKTMSTLYIFTDKSLENSIGELISIYFKDDILGFNAGKGCVHIYLPDRDKTNKLQKTLKSYANKVI